ncbi:MAG: SDR family NAD(P)-dependent oxidoreductase [Sneathiella sp.]
MLNVASTLGKSIAITGASSGIGAALARHYAANKCIIALGGRDLARLKLVARECEELGAKTTIAVIDVQILPEVEAWISRTHSENPLDIVFVNAGITGGVGEKDKFESVNDVNTLLSINLVGATNTIGAALAEMSKVGAGQIVVTNSLAGYVGFPGSPSYCASKAGLRIYCESLQRLLKSSEIDVTLIFPGYVSSPMSRKVVSSKPLEISAEKAALLISKAVAKRKKKMGFPYLLWTGVRLLSILPLAMQNYLIPIFDLKVDVEK